MPWSFFYTEKRFQLIIKKDEKFAVDCQVKMAADCLQNSEFFYSQEDALDWVEEECWINSGEGWICTQCHEQILRNITKLAKPKGF